MFPSFQRAPSGQWLSSSPPTPVQLQDAKGEQGVERDADQRMSEAAMMSEARDWINEIHDHVNVGNFCGDDHGGGGQGRLAVEAQAAEAGAGEQMSDGFQLTIFSLSLRF